MTDDSPLTGQVAVVTGASQGIGAAIAKTLASLGANVVLTSRNKAKLDQVAQEISAHGGQASVRACDLTDAEAIAEFAQHVLSTHRHCGILVNNAGIGTFDRPLHDFEPDLWDEMFATNLRAPYLLIRAFAPSMIAAKHGHIVNVSSLAGKNPVPNASAYAATKWGLNGLTVSVAEELRQHQVRVSLVCPGTVQTEFAGGFSVKKTALGALQPDDVAHVVAMLVTQADQSFVSDVSIRPLLKK